MSKSHPFKKKYSAYYDLMYSSTKNYQTEANHLNEIFNKYFNKKISILDLACGTGNHSIALVKKGHTVEGLDASKEMINIAKNKAASQEVNIKFHVSPMQSFKINSQFEAVICMFASMDYLINDKDILRMLKRVKKVLKPNGLFLFDFWDEKEFLNHNERFRVKDVGQKGIRLIRIAESANDIHRKILKVKVNCLVIKNKKIIDEFSEFHCSRYFQKKEIIYFLEKSGFEIVKIYRPEQNNWFLNCLARNKIEPLQGTSYGKRKNI